MKELRGTTILFIIFVVLGGIVWWQKQHDEALDKTPQLFAFEKHLVIGATIERPNQEDIILSEINGEWWLLDDKRQPLFEANETMVNRIRHQLHDLEARALVTEKAEKPALYGLGEKAIRVSIDLKNGEQIQFLAGDPNPTGVSYYIQPLSGQKIYTVKKSALDYYSASFTEFRNPHFVKLDTKAVRQFSVTLQEEEYFFHRIDEHRWKMISPQKMRVSEEKMKLMIGRAIALKAAGFIEDKDSTVDYGFENPALRLHFILEDGQEVEIAVGNKTDDVNFSYFTIKGSDTIFVAKNGLLEEFDFTNDELRDRIIFDLKTEDIQSIELKIVEEKIQMQQVLSQWKWRDGSSVAGSTARRLAEVLADLRVAQFVDEVDRKQTVATITIGQNEEEKTLFIGEKAKDKIVGTERYPQRYVQLEGRKEAFIVDEHFWNVTKELIREHKTHTKIEKGVEK